MASQSSDSKRRVVCTGMGVITPVADGHDASRLKINAPKSMLGHTCWSAPAVETVAALGQMRRGRVHASINVESLDPAVDLDVRSQGPVDHEVDVFLKNAFGFGGTNCCALWKRVRWVRGATVRSGRCRVGLRQRLSRRRLRPADSSRPRCRSRGQRPDGGRPGLMPQEEALAALMAGHHVLIRGDGPIAQAVE